MINLEYWKMMFKTEIGQIGIPECPNRAILWDRAFGSI